MNLSPAAFEKAAKFVKSYARPIDIRLFEFYFEGGSAESVLAELAAYQNADGGFGHGIEPDIQLAESSPMATSVAFQYIQAVNAGIQNSMIARAIQYLLSTYRLNGEYWPPTFENVNDAPHAPWWHVTELQPPPEENWANPNAELLGYLHCYAPFVPPDVLDLVTARARRNLLSQDTIGGLMRYNVMCWQRALPYLPSPLQSEVRNHLRATFAGLGTLSPHTFEEASIAWIAPSPDSILAQMQPEAVRDLLDGEIQRQAEDGGWWPNWTWGQYEDAWETAKQEWAGKITVELLHVLRQYGKA